MKENNVDQEIKNSIVNGTADASRKKEEIWANIEKELNLSKGVTEMKLEPRASKKRKKKSRGWLTGTIAAVLLLGIFATTTDTGQAVMNNIKEYFAPQKQIVEDIEGMPEEKEVTLQEGKAGYIIYIDEENYTLVQEDEFDKIVFNLELDERYPEISMTIKQVENKTPAQLADEKYEELTASFDTVWEVTKVSEPLEGLVITAIAGLEWNSPMKRVYVVSNEKEGSFLIEQTFYVEAEEGHGARFDQMLKDFQVVEVNDL